jgi:DNA-binding CsgD family transcriptional regulator
MARALFKRNSWFRFLPQHNFKAGMRSICSVRIGYVMPDLSHKIFDLIDKVVVATTVSDVLNVYLHAAKDVGLRYVQAGFLPHEADTNIRSIASVLPKGCLEGYLSNELFAGDMVAELMRNTTHSFEWALSDWNVAEMTPLQRRWREHCLTFGIEHGVCVLDFRPGESMQLGTFGPAGRLLDHDRMALFFAGQEVLHRLREIGAADTASAAALSRRERQCLEWAAAGKTDWEIGHILSLSEKTVNVYIDRAKGKFGVKSRAQAIVLAAKTGAINI